MLEWTMANPWKTFFLGLVLAQGIYGIVVVVLNTFSRFFRHLSIRKAGWPPEHLDADGDWKP